MKNTAPHILPRIALPGTQYPVLFSSFVVHATNEIAFPGTPIARDGARLLGCFPPHSAGFLYAVTTTFPPKPRLCCSPTLAPLTWRGPHSPRNCQFNSAHCATPVAPSGWPFEIRPPEGFMTYLPPNVLSPLSTNLCPCPSFAKPYCFIRKQFVATGSNHAIQRLAHHQGLC